MLIMERIIYLFAALYLWTSTSYAQFPPPRQGIQTINSKFNDGVTISYKQVSAQLESQTKPNILKRIAFAKLHLTSSRILAMFTFLAILRHPWSLRLQTLICSSGSSRVEKIQQTRRLAFG
jgi:hypothetical protein